MTFNNRTFASLAPTTQVNIARLGGQPSARQTFGGYEVIALPGRLAQIRREPFFHGGYGFASPGRVINRLIASDLPDAEIFRIRMRKIQPAHAGARMHRKRLRQPDPCVVSCIEQIEERSFLGVIWTRWITGGRPNAAIFFTNQISIGELFVTTKSPRNASFFMQIFGKRFSQSVGQSFGHDRAVVVVLTLELLGKLIRAMD